MASKQDSYFTRLLKSNKKDIEFKKGFLLFKNENIQKNKKINDNSINNKGSNVTIYQTNAYPMSRDMKDISKREKINGSINIVKAGLFDKFINLNKKESIENNFTNNPFIRESFKTKMNIIIDEANIYSGHERGYSNDMEVGKLNSAIKKIRENMFCGSIDKKKIEIYNILSEPNENSRSNNIFHKRERSNLLKKKIKDCIRLNIIDNNHCSVDNRKKNRNVLEKNHITSFRKINKALNFGTSREPVLSNCENGPLII